MYKIIHDVEFEGQVLELEIHVDHASVKWGNNGIGSYEFWGQKCYDSGTDYIEEFEAEKIIDLSTGESVTDQRKKEITEALYDDEDFMAKLEEKVLAYESEMRMEAELDARYSTPTESIFD
jgi:hypothetical protein